MIKKLITPVLLCSVAVIPCVKARFTDGFLVGGIAGLTTGLIASAVAQNCKKPDVVVVEEPVMVYEKAPTYVVYEEPVVVRQKTCFRRRAELALREERIRQAERKQQAHKEAELRAREDALLMQQPKRIVSKTIVETRRVKAHEDTQIKERELALKERQLELDLIKEKKELVREENRKKELALKEKEIQRKRIKALDKAENEANVEEIVTKTVKRVVA